jgi:hypothetical protein
MWERTKAAMYAESLRPRFVARPRMACRSPGRRRIVIRSRAVSRSDRTRLPADPRLAESNRPRIAIRASLLSEIPRAAAMDANRCFSSAVGRAVIDGRLRLLVLSLMTRHCTVDVERLALSVLGLGDGRIAKCPQCAAWVLRAAHGAETIASSGLVASAAWKQRLPQVRTGSIRGAG